MRLVKTVPSVRLGLFCAGVLLIVSAGSAEAANCGGAVIDKRFAEASRLCGARERPAGLTVGRVELADTPRSASVSMPGYRRRLENAARAVRAARRAPTDALVTAIAQRYRINPHLLASMMRAESAGRPGAVSHKGALGLMQVMRATARSLGVRDPRAMLRDPVLAVSTGAVYLKKLQSQLGNNVPLVVAAYNAGPGAVIKAGRRVPRYRETQGYVRKVMGDYTAAMSGAAR